MQFASVYVVKASVILKGRCRCQPFALFPASRLVVLEVLLTSVRAEAGRWV